MSAGLSGAAAGGCLRLRKIMEARSVNRMVVNVGIPAIVATIIQSALTSSVSGPLVQIALKGYEMIKKLCRIALLATLGACANLAAAGGMTIDSQTFDCIRNMTPVRGFFVSNLQGNIEGTLAVANAGSGTYPPGSVVQLVPTEVMVKHEAGFSPATGDWEFIELDVSAEGSTIRTRGFVDVVNRFGGNCFACHIKANPDRDMICETGHGCDPIPLTATMIKAIQNTDPRCEAVELPPEQVEALQQLQSVLANPAQSP
jgi:hypothetical protein